VARVDLKSDADTGLGGRWSESAERLWIAWIAIVSILWALWYLAVPTVRSLLRLADRIGGRH